MSTHEREKDQQGHLDDQGNMEMEEKEPRTSGRLHEKTQKGHELYLENLNKQKSKLANLEKRINSDIFESTSTSDSAVLVKVCDRIEANLKNYENTYHECCEYLKRQNNEESFKELDLMNKCFTPFHDDVIQCLQKLKPLQTRKKTDEESTSSRLSIKSLQKLEEAKTKLKITERAIELKRQKSKLIIEENLNVAK